MSAPIAQQNEEAPLLAGRRGQAQYGTAKKMEKGKVKIEPLRYAEVPKAAREGLNAIYSDSLYRYFRGGNHTPGPFFSTCEKLQMDATFSDAIRRRRILTVDQGYAICYYGLPGEKEGRLASWVKKGLRWMQPAELAKRKTEFSETAQSLAKSAFGEQMDDMIEIRGLAVSTKKQRRGYGTALVDAVHAIADEQGRAVWLVTTDAVGFYETVGYRKIRERWIGASNPAWDGPPVPVRVMVREPQATGKDRVKVFRH